MAQPLVRGGGQAARGLGIFMLLACGVAGASKARAADFRQTLIDIAEGHPRVEAAEEDALAAAYDIATAKAPARPQVQVTTDAGLRRNSLANSSLVRPGVIGSQLLFDGGRTAADVRRARARAEGLGAERDVVLEEVAARLAEAFLAWRRETALLAIADEQVTALRQVTDMVREIAGFDRGRAADVSLAATRLAQAESAREGRLLAIADARAEIQRIAAAPVEPEGDLPALDGLLPRTLDEALAALDANPAIKAAANRGAEARETARVASRYRYPTLAAQGGAVTDYARDGRMRAFNTYELSLRMSFPAFDGGAGGSRLASARATSASADRQLAFVRADAEGAVRRQWALIGQRSARIETLAGLVETTDRSRDTVFEQFRIGRRSVLDLLSFETDRFAARIALESERQDLIAARYRLLAAMAATAETLLPGGRPTWQ